MNPDNPVIVQSDRTILLETNHPNFEVARDRLSLFSELEKSLEYMYTYRMTPLSLWNAAASGMSAPQVVDSLKELGKFPLPLSIEKEIEDLMGRYGKYRLEKAGDQLVLCSDRPQDLQDIIGYSTIHPYIGDPAGDGRYAISPHHRGPLKQQMIKLGYPVQDLAGYTEGQALHVELNGTLADGAPFSLRDYQKEAVRVFHAAGSVYGGSGVLVLPCGSGKTVIGIAAMAEMKVETLILTTNTTSVKQWVEEILEKTNLEADAVGRYTGEQKEIRPVTVATYQILTHRKSKDEAFTHMALFNERNWGLIIYDEVHLLPAPVFRATADIQAKRRLGLTATLVREDEREEDVFALVGPKKMDVSWKRLEEQGWIAEATCREIRVPLPPEERERYATASSRMKFRRASENPAKIDVLKRIIHRHRGEQILIIGQYLDQLKIIRDELNIPLITGRVKQEERDRLYRQFKSGELSMLAVSKVANFAVDLPDASVAVQISGTFGSRQEEAQRLGRILRPKKRGNRAFFYTLVSRETQEQDYAMKRQLFLVEQGYRYECVEDWTLERLECPS